MWLQHSVLLALTLLVCTPTSEARWYDPFPQCDSCAKTAADLGLDIIGILGPSESAVRKMCRLHPKMEDICVLTEEHVFDALKELTVQLFPRQSSKTSTELTCTHILNLCADKSEEGKEVPKSKWSCKMCEEGLNLLLKLSEPITKINNALPPIFCAKEDQECMDAFSDAIEIGGALGDLIKKLRSTKSICKRTLDCVDL